MSTKQKIAYLMGRGVKREFAEFAVAYYASLAKKETRTR